MSSQCMNVRLGYSGGAPASTKQLAFARARAGGSSVGVGKVMGNSIKGNMSGSKRQTSGGGER